MGLAWQAGKLYVADPPDLVALEDTDGDGAADQRTVILTGFGHLDNGSLHGLVFGPDGWLYMTMGSPDGYRLHLPDGSFITGESGALIRCRPDGSEPHVLCRGFVNLVEVAFTPRGEIIGTDNWFRDVNEKGSEGLRDALVHLVDGGLYPYLGDVGTPQPITGDTLGPVSLFPAVALSGLEVDRGPSFPAEFRGSLFSAQHNARKVGRHVLVQDGSTFRSGDFDFLASTAPDFHPSDVLQAADGSLLVVDTGSWYTHHCPTGNIRDSHAPGGIYRVRYEKVSTPGDPWGNSVDWPHASTAELVRFLADERRAVRDRAHSTLVSCGEMAVPLLVESLDAASDAAIRQRIIWTLASIPGDRARQAIRGALDEADDVAATAARALASLKDHDAASALHELLARESPHVRLAAAEALAYCGTSDSAPVLWRCLAETPDGFLEHALVHALHRLADVKALIAALGSEHPRVRQAALTLLDQPPRPPGAVPLDAVLANVSATDPELRRTAVGILQRRPEWTDRAVDLARDFLQADELSNDQQQSLRGLILALQSDPALQEVVAASLSRPAGKSAIAREVDLLRTLADCSLSPPPPLWVEAIGQQMASENPAVRQEAVRTAAIWQVPALVEPLARIAESAAEPAALRVGALGAVISRRPDLSPDVFEMLMEQMTSDDPLARLQAAEIAGRGALTSVQWTRVLTVAGEDPLISPSVLLPAVQRSGAGESVDVVLAYLKRSLTQGWRPPPAELRDFLHAASISEPAAQELIDLLKGTQDHHKELDRYQPLLAGGVPERGRSVFFGNKVACASCHRIGAEGGSVGPDLTRIGTVRSARDLVESIVIPNSTLAQGYESFLVTTQSGRTLTGTTAHQSASVLTLRDSSGTLHRIARDDIDELARVDRSLMPDGLARALSPEEFQDLLAFLQSLK
jgi:putative heme-binding domain-containing protein